MNRNFALNTKMRANSDDDEPLWLLGAVGVVFGVTKSSQVYCTLRLDLRARPMSNVQRLAPVR